MQTKNLDYRYDKCFFIISMKSIIISDTIIVKMQVFLREGRENKLFVITEKGYFTLYEDNYKSDFQWLKD